MAYDIHIFRGKNWWEGTANPITAEELLSVEGVKCANSVTSTNLNPRDGEAWWAAVYGVAQSRTQLKQLSSSSMADITEESRTEAQMML